MSQPPFSDSLNASSIYALIGTIGFSTASILYRHFAYRLSTLWMNTLKTCVAIVCFFIAVSLQSGWSVSPPPAVVSFLMLSGFIGLCMGDLLLLKRFS